MRIETHRHSRKEMAMIMLARISIAAFLIVALSVCPRHAIVTHAGVPKGIILISLDTLRADHLGIYGYHRNTSPYIDAFAKESIVFENALVQSPWTLPSHMSIMTSLYPSSHGVVVRNNRLADEHVTLAELLGEKGYKTAAFADGAFMKGDYGFKQGFDMYDGDNWIGIARILPKAEKWLEENKANPFFLFIHCYDIHDPYAPPPPYDTIFHDFNYTGNFIPSTRNMQAAAWKGKEVNDDDLRHIKALYDGGIGYTDAKIGEFLSYLQEAGLKENTLIIITSDHGEEFREHGSFLHWKLYFRPNLHVPLMMHIPNYPKKEIRIKELVQSIDILPTILDIAQLPPHPEAQGRSLLSLIKRNSTFIRRFWWRLLHPFSNNEKAAFAEHQQSRGKRRQEYSMITDDYQIINSVLPQSVELFHIKDDPLAQINIAMNHEGLVDRFLLQLNKNYSVLPKYKAEIFILDEHTRGQLRALGYMDDTDDNAVCSGDADCDGIADDDDNCPFISNPDQKDTYPPQGNGIGDSCDCEGDFNCDGSVDEADSDLLRKNVLQSMLFTRPCTSENQCHGDFDCDGDIDEDDKAVFNDDFGRGKKNNPCPPCTVGVWCSY
jgi:arylsulfatase A-like enzyme